MPVKRGRSVFQLKWPVPALESFMEYPITEIEYGEDLDPTE
jgi:hypothetical protein